MKNVPDSGLLKPAASRIEAKADATTRTARQIIEREAAAIRTKTERLRAARLAQEADQPPPPEKKPRKKR